MDECNKTCQTIMIGSLSVFERKFGHLWGQEKDDDFTDDENRWYNLWQEARTEILDFGNKHINKYRYNYDIKVLGKRKD